MHTGKINSLIRVITVLLILASSGICSADRDVVAELKFGVLVHDVHIFSYSRKEDGIDLNGEILFNLPDNRFFSVIGNPRFHVGGSVNSQGGTNLGYFGLTWDVKSESGIFVEGSFGGAVHDGKLDTVSFDRKVLGSRVLFRIAGGVGFQFDRQHSLALMLDHVSNAGLATPNEGMDNVGIRYGFQF